MRSRILALPAALVVSVAAVAGVGGCTAGYFTENVGDGCVRFRNAADAGTGGSCSIEGGCTQFTDGDGGLLELKHRTAEHA